MKPETHDYTKRYWGHDYTFEPVNGGLQARLMGWGMDIKAGDYLLLQNGDDSTRYQVDSIKYYSDPFDMWSATATFAPRPGRTKGDPVTL
jgi:hypothetical protein